MNRFEVKVDVWETSLEHLGWMKLTQGSCPTVGRSTCEGGISKPLCNIQQDTKKCHKKGYPERKHKEMATSMGGNNERGDY
jgi:hypothetical protein